MTARNSAALTKPKCDVFRSQT